MRAFDAISFFPRKEDQLMALAAAFVIMAEACKIDPPEVYSAVLNLMVDDVHSDRRKHEFAAMKYHLESEVLA